LAFIDEFVYWYHRFCLNVFVAGLEWINSKVFCFLPIDISFLLLYAWSIKILQV
jgi:hypothetical protein